MRDIRKDLRERLDLLRRERDDLQAKLNAKLAEIDAYEQQVKSLLAMEEARVGGDSAGQAILELIADKAEPEEQAEEASADKPRFAADILRVLADGRNYDLDAIKDGMSKRGWHAEKKGAFGRQIHGVLLTLKNRGAVDYLGASVWRKAKVSAASAA